MLRKGELKMLGNVYVYFILKKSGFTWRAKRVLILHLICSGDLLPVAT